MRSNRGRATTLSHRVGAAVATMALATLVAGCGGGGGSGGDAMSADPGASQAEGGAAGSGGSGQAAPESAPGSANRATVQTRAVIRTGQVALTSKELDETRAEVDQLLFALDGAIDSEQTSHDDDGNIARSTLVLRVPVAKFKAAMDALEQLGKVQTSDSKSKNVTTEVIDIDERVDTIANSLDRLQRFQRQSQNIDDLILFESEITERESELRSLRAQQAYLADQTSMSTITLYLSTPDRYVAPPDALEDAGFLTGLKSGWNALKDFVVVVLTVFGAALPFLVAIGLVGVPTWLLVRALIRRRVSPAEPPPASGAA